jgi:hypothetical protein
MCPNTEAPPRAPRSWPVRIAVAVYVALLLAGWVGAVLLALGVLLAWQIEQSSISLAIAGTGVLLIFISLIARGYWP